MDIKEKLASLENELQETIKAIEIVKEQISIYNKKGQELSAHATFINGKIEVLKEILKEGE